MNSGWWQVKETIWWKDLEEGWRDKWDEEGVLKVDGIEELGVLGEELTVGRESGLN